MHIVCSFTSGYFSIYNDEYGHVHFGDDDIMPDIQGFIVPPDIRLHPTSMTMMGQESVQTAWWAHACTCEPCVWKYHTSNLSELEATSMMILNDRSLIMSCMCLHSLIPIMGSLIEYFLKFLDLRLIHVIAIFNIYLALFSFCLYCFKDLFLNM